MIDREAVVERVLGWQKRFSPDPTIYAWERPDGERITRYDVLKGFTDAELVAMVEDEIERRQLQDGYITRLSEIISINLYDFDGGSRHVDAFRLLRATPEQRCEAASQAVEET